ncbi:MAG: NADH-ubiquinone oxidoreductase chain G, partial [uncultured Phycisphaerae bacterium]
AQVYGRRHHARRQAGSDDPPGLQRGRRGHPPVLLPPGAVDRRVLPDLPGRGRGDAQARAGLPDAGPGGDGRPRQELQGDRQPEAGHGVPADQPPARLPGVRPGRRVPAAGLLVRLRPQPEPVRGGQAEEPEEGRRRPRHAVRGPVHHVYPVRAVHPRGVGDGRAVRRGPRAQGGDRDLPRPAGEQQDRRQRGRPLPGRGAAGQGLPVQAAGVAAAGDAERQPGRRRRREHLPAPQRGRRLPGQAAVQRRREHLVDQRRHPVQLQGVVRRQPAAAGPQAAVRRAGRGDVRQGDRRGRRRAEERRRHQRRGEPVRAAVADDGVRGGVPARQVRPLARPAGNAGARPGADSRRGRRVPAQHQRQGDVPDQGREGAERGRRPPGDGPARRPAGDVRRTGHGVRRDQETEGRLGGRRVFEQVAAGRRAGGAQGRVPGRAGHPAEQPDGRGRRAAAGRRLGREGRLLGEPRRPGPAVRRGHPAAGGRPPGGRRLLQAARPAGDVQRRGRAAGDGRAIRDGEDAGRQGRGAGVRVRGAL